MAPPLTRRLGYSIDSAMIELFMSLNYESMNEDTFKQHFRDNMHASLKLILLCFYVLQLTLKKGGSSLDFIPQS